MEKFRPKSKSSYLNIFHRNLRWRLLLYLMDAHSSERVASIVCRSILEQLCVAAMFNKLQFNIPHPFWFKIVSKVEFDYRTSSKKPLDNTVI